MPSPSRLLVCPKCACHAKLDALECPCCGYRVRSPEGWLVPAAAVLAMGLSVATCADDTTSSSSSSSDGGGGASFHGDPTAAGYTVAVSVGSSSHASSGEGTGGDAGAGGAGGIGGMAGAGGTSGGAGGVGGK